MLLIAVLVQLQSLDSAPIATLHRELEVREAASGEPWGRIGTALYIPGGGLLVVDHSTGLPYRFDAEGHAIGALGRSGAGPGEFRNSAWVGRRADSTWVWDQRLQRLTVYGPDWVLRRTVAPAIRSSGLVVQRNGDLLVLPPRPTTAQQLSILRMGPAGDLRDTVHAAGPLRRPLQIVLPGGARLTAEQPLADDPILTLSGDGAGWVEVSRGTDAACSVAVEVGGNGPGWRRTFACRSLPVPSRLVDSLVTRISIGPEGVAPMAVQQQIRSSLFVPPRLPPVRAVQVFEDGCIWLQRGDVAGHYTVLSRVGEVAFDVRLDHGGRLVGAEGPRLWVAEADSEGAEILVQYRIDTQR